MNNKKRILISVSNDLFSDRRVYKVAKSLVDAGFEVRVLGRRLKNSLPVDFPYSTSRMKLLFNKGPLFYANLNLRLFLKLIFSNADIFLANDLDTLPANFLASRIKRKKLIYDSHELFTEVPELQHRKKVQRIWEKIEARILPRVKFSYTVCRSIADFYRKKYGIDMQVARNIPEKEDTVGQTVKNPVQLPGDKKVIIYQGALNVGRGLELAIEAMKYIDEAVLLIVGGGDIENHLRELVEINNLTTKIFFTGRIPFHETGFYTKQAHLGISIEENLGLNYYFALPNKLFDYIRAGVPVLVSQLPEMARIVEDYKIGMVLQNRTARACADAMREMLGNESARALWKTQLSRAADELSWENEMRNILPLFSD